MKFSFNTKDRLYWLVKVAELVSKWKSIDGRLEIDFPTLSVSEIGPEHITPLACLIEHLARHKVMVAINTECPVGEHLANVVQLARYWKGHENYAETGQNNILNLWRINKSEIEIHPRRVETFLKSTFKDKDLSAVSLGLTETYYNVQDHANCAENAFSMISYNDAKKVLNISVCDFGDGIPTTVRRVIPDLSDIDALAKAMEENFSIKSTSHNAGKGLNNIKSLCNEKNSYLWIVSNNAVLAATAEQQRVYHFQSNFPGTWVYYRIPLDLLPEEEYEDEFNW